MRKTAMDVGMYDGTDTQRYLDAGYDVVGIEANPRLVKQLQRRFAQEIADGRLRIVARAIAAQAGRVTLYVPDDRADFPVALLGSLDRDFAAHWASGLGVDQLLEVDVAATRFSDVLLAHGVPDVLKCDIEGMDHLILDGLRGCDKRPELLSVESRVRHPGATLRSALAELRAMRLLGYRRFSYVNQRSGSDIVIGACTGQPRSRYAVAALRCVALWSYSRVCRALPDAYWRGRAIPGPWDLTAAKVG